MKYLSSLLFCLVFSLGASAQKYALIDMEYILGNIPAYERANEQLNQVSKKWQAEVEAVDNAAKTLYKNYQNELVFLSEQQKKEREEAIIAKEREASELRKKYFLELANRGAVLVSPSISPGEKTIMRAAFDAGFPLIILQENGFTNMTKPTGSRFEACAAGKILILAPWEHHNQRLNIKREQCLSLNEMAKTICTSLNK